MDLKENLIDEIKASRIFKFYKLLTIATSYTKTYRKAMILLFIIGFINQIFGTNIVFINWMVFIGIIPGILFVLTAGATHLLAGIRIRSLCSKYGIDRRRMKETIEEKLK